MTNNFISYNIFNYTQRPALLAVADLSEEVGRVRLAIVIKLHCAATSTTRH